MLSVDQVFQHEEPAAGQPHAYAMFDLEDMTGMMRCILWPEDFAAFGHWSRPTPILAVRGVIDKRPGSEEANLIVNELDSVWRSFPPALRGASGAAGFRAAARPAGPGAVARDHLRGYPGASAVQLVICLSDGTRSFPCQCDSFKVEIDAQGDAEPREKPLLGPGISRIQAAPHTPSAPRNGNRLRPREEPGPEGELAVASVRKRTCAKCEV